MKFNSKFELYTKIHPRKPIRNRPIQDEEKTPKQPKTSQKTSQSPESNRKFWFFENFRSENISKAFCDNLFGTTPFLGNFETPTPIIASN